MHFLDIFSKKFFLGIQKFRYAFFPHQKSWEEADIVEEGMKFNEPLIVKVSKSSITQTQTYFQITPLIGPESLVIDTIKLSEDDLSKVVLRLYDTKGTRGTSRLTRF